MSVYTYAMKNEFIPVKYLHIHIKKTILLSLTFSFYVMSLFSSESAFVKKITACVSSNIFFKRKE